MARARKLGFTSGEAVKKLRRELGRNQADFWGPVGVTQSGGSRYESGREMPRPVQILLTIAYGSEKQSEAVVEALRSKS